MSNQTSVRVSRNADGNINAVESEATPYTPSEPVQAGVTTDVHQGSTSVSISHNGNTSSQHRAHTRVRSGDAVADNMADNPGSVLASVRSASTGRPLTQDEITPDARVTIDGMEVTVANAERMGLLSRNELGKYADTGNGVVLDEPPAKATIDDIEHAIYKLPGPVKAVTQAALSGLDNEVTAQNVLVNVLMGNDVNWNDLASRNGRDADAIAQDYEAAASGLVNSVSRMLNIDPASFGQLVATGDPTEGGDYIRDALRHLIIEGNSHKMVELYRKGGRSVTPSVEFLTEKGYQTKRGTDGKLMVLVEEEGITTWLAAAVARRLGMV